MKIKPQPVPRAVNAGHQLRAALAKATGAPPPPPPPLPPQEDYLSQAGFTPDGDLWVYCEVTEPPSSAGKSAVLVVPHEQVPDLLRLVRDAAISLRNTPQEVTP